MPEIFDGLTGAIGGNQQVIASRERTNIDWAGAIGNQVSASLGAGLLEFMAAKRAGNVHEAASGRGVIVSSCGSKTLR